MNWPQSVVVYFRKVAWLIGIGFLASTALAEEPEAKSPERPNIIFFLSDDHRASFLGCAGHPILRTPHLDVLAAKGVRFENAFVTTSICAASRASILTGLHERSHGFTFGTAPLSSACVEQSYPSLLKRQGYRTGFVGKFGVQVPDGSTASMFDAFHPLGRSPYYKHQPDGSKRHVCDITGDRAIDFLKAADPQQPFCLSVSFNSPHAEDGDLENHYPSPPSVEGWYEDVIPDHPRLVDTYENHPIFLKESLNRDRWFWRWDTPEKYQKNVRAYYRMISGVDAVIGRVLEELERLELAENTVIIFSGDNGYYKGDRGFAGKWSHYEESLRVPLIVYDPRSEAEGGRVAKEMVLNIDIPATILELAEATVPESYQGRGLAEIADGGSAENWRTDFFCEHLMEHERIPKWEGIRDSRYVYARYFEQDPPYEFLHDLEADPDQVRNFVNEPTYQTHLEALRTRCDFLSSSYELEVLKENQ